MIPCLYRNFPMMFIVRCFYLVVQTGCRHWLRLNENLDEVAELTVAFLRCPPSSILSRLRLPLLSLSRPRHTHIPLQRPIFLSLPAMSDVPVESAAPAAAPAAAIPELTAAPAEVDAPSKRPRSPTPPPTTTASSSTAEASTSASMSDPKKAKLETPALTEEELAMNAPAPALPAPNAGRGSSAARGKKPARKWDGKDRLPGTGPGRMSRNARDIEDAAIIAAGGTPEKREGAEPRLPKKKTVVMLGFSGTGRKGMQMYVSGGGLRLGGRGE